MNQTETGLNPMQMEAVEHTEGPLLILAGAGSGKTRVLTHRIASLIRDKGVNPWNIMAITFTNKAAGEMRERVDKIVGYGSERIWVSTFHSSCVRILRRHAERLGYANNFAIYDTDDQKSLIKDIMKRLQMDPKLYRDRAIMAAISSAKDEMIEPDQYRIDAGIDWKLQKYAAVYAEYQAELKKNNAMDFDDLLVQTVKLFQQFPEVLDYYQEQFRYIMVDEYQDTNTVQFRFVSLLAAKYRNLCVVGDDDQSIYRFRGAKPEIMLGFEKDFPGTKRVLLGTNYRSTKEIVETSLRLIEHNKVRFEKKLEPFRGSGRPVDFRVFDNPGHEMDTVAQSIRAYHDAGYQWSEIAVLFRTGANSGLMAERLMGYNIPFKLRDVIPNLYSHWIAKDLFAYMEIAAGSRKRSDFYRIMNRPNRYFSRDAFDTPTVSFDRLKSFYQDRDWMEDRICDLEADLRTMSRLKPVAAVNYIRKVIGYDDYLRSYAEFRRMKPEELFETADKLAESAAEFETFEAWKEHAVRYEEELKKQNLEETREARDRVTLSTMHSAKGLEYPVVFVVDVNEGIVPHHKAGLPADIEEERRLFYVALTRAKDRLHVAAVRERYHRKTDVSRFIGEAGL